ncbi:MAG: helix-turn-helix transcriptional regulator [Verrucomicrobiota bacterium]
MSQNHKNMVETTIDGENSLCWRVTSEQYRGFEAHRIARVGEDNALPPYERVRLFPQGSFLMVALQGSGSVLLEGVWQRVSAGTVCMAPPRVLNAFRADRGKVWRFVWVRFEEAKGSMSVVGAASPVKIQGGKDLTDAILGFRREWEGERNPVLLRCWEELIAATAQRLAQPFQQSERLGGLWDKVAAALSEDWSVTRLATEARMSEEHLRRVCSKELGRTPMQQVTSLRINAAFTLLETGRDKLDVLAEKLGYSDAFVFSKVFKRVTGLSPMDYRAGRLCSE